MDEDVKRNVLADAATIRDIVSMATRQSLGPMRLGVDDCAPFFADLVRSIHGRDPMARWRGRYHDDETLRAMLDACPVARGSYARAVLAGIVSIGACRIRTDEATDGDLGLVMPPGGMAPAIRCGGFWIFRTTGGVGHLPDAAKAWRVTHGH